MTYKSDNAFLYLKYDQRFWNHLSVFVGVRAEYYSVATIGNVDGKNLASYWKKHNTDYFTIDMICASM